MVLLQSIPDEVEKIVNKYGTRDPFKIAKKRGIQLIYSDLGEEVYGFYTKVNRIQFIHLNIRLGEKELTFACEHELGHCIHHPDENTPLLSKVNLNSSVKIEAQANCFATYLQIDGTHKDELYMTSNLDVINYYGLPKEMERFLKYDFFSPI